MKNKIVAAAVAMVLILICFVPMLLFFSQKKTASYEIVCFGDSVMACTYADGTVPYYIGELAGRTSLNAAFGGLSMSKGYAYRKAGDTGSFFSMTELSEALANRDFTLQVMSTKPGIKVYSEEWKNVTKRLASMDYDSVRYVIIEHGVNDYLSGVQIDDETDRYNVYTFAGALRTSIENVQKAIPEAKIVIVSPTYTYLSTFEKDCYETDCGGGTLPDYVAKEKEVAAEYGLTFVDNLNGSGINKDNYADYLYDGLHAHQDGNRLIAENIVRNVEGIIKDEITP